MRTFIAIELSDEIRNFLAGLQEKLKTSGADVKWVKPGNIHLTLKFLGEIDDKKLNEIIQILQEITKDKEPFYIRPYSLGAFPRIESPRVIWIGIDKGDEQVKQIAQALDEKIQKIGVPAEGRKFSSHITIGRIRSSLNRQNLIKILNNYAHNLGGQAPKLFVDKIILFKSTLTPPGPIYEILHTANLKTT